MNETQIEQEVMDVKNPNWKSFWTVLGFELRRNLLSRGFIIFLGVYLFMGIFLSIIIGSSFEAMIQIGRAHV